MIPCLLLELDNGTVNQSTRKIELSREQVRQGPYGSVWVVDSPIWCALQAKLLLLQKLLPLLLLSCKVDTDDTKVSTEWYMQAAPGAATAVSLWPHVTGLFQVANCLPVLSLSAVGPSAAAAPDNCGFLDT